MKLTIITLIFFLTMSNFGFTQSIDDNLSRKKMKEDLKIFQDIRFKANSGLYKYRTKKEIDSIYSWANQEIEKSNTYRDFYNIICQLTDFEGSLHNSDILPKKMHEGLKKEKNGYFPYPIKWIEGKWIVNFKNGEIPLGAEIVSIQGTNIDVIVQSLYKYYTTDGVNKTAKIEALNSGFSKFYRLSFGKKDSFKVKYKLYNEENIIEKTLSSISSHQSDENLKNRYSAPFDFELFLDYDEFKEKYFYREIDNKTSILTINTFVMGWNESDNDHKKYVRFLDSVFLKIKENKVKNLIVDIRNNGGGTDPNDQVTYSYLTNRKFSENKQAWISFNKVPYLKYMKSTIPRFLRPFFIRKFNRELQEEFPDLKNGKFYQNNDSEDHKIREPNDNAFNGKVYLLIGPRVASAGSMFSAMVVGNKNTITIGQETMGGYYGHNGHTPLTYTLPNSKIETTFSIVNLEQDVPYKDNQIYNRGIIPDYDVSQSYTDYIVQKDTVMSFVLELIKRFD